MVNDICNRAGIDTISGGTVISFAIGYMKIASSTKKDTDGIELKWGKSPGNRSDDRESGKKGRHW